MKTAIPVYKFMTPLPIRLNLTDTIHKAEYIMNDMCIRHLPVVNNEKVVGLISITDIARVAEVDKTIITCENLMTTPVVSIHETEELENIIPLFTAKKFHAVPVLDYEDKLVGIVSTRDVIKFMFDYIKTENVWNREYKS